MINRRVESHRRPSFRVHSGYFVDPFSWLDIVLTNLDKFSFRVITSVRVCIAYWFKRDT
jgi:hypothetical protein